MANSTKGLDIAPPDIVDPKFSIGIYVSSYLSNNTSSITGATTPITDFTTHIYLDTVKLPSEVFKANGYPTTSAPKHWPVCRTLTSWRKPAGCGLPETHRARRSVPAGTTTRRRTGFAAPAIADVSSSGSASANGRETACQGSVGAAALAGRVQPRAGKANAAIDCPVNNGLGVPDPQAQAALPAAGHTLDKSDCLLTQDNGLQLPQQLVSLSDEEPKT